MHREYAYTYQNERVLADKLYEDSVLAITAVGFLRMHTQ